ncbi:MAG: acyltransferase family protein [Clostridiales bacterium]|nr:acyltransferase family protein [Clostridiales bacterium]
MKNNRESIEWGAYEMTDAKRSTELDILRILAMLAVISIHVDTVAQSWIDTLIRNIEFSAVTWCVPVYVMISGRLFLEKRKQLPVSAYFKKYILRIVVAFAFWSAIYQVMYIALGAYDDLNWKGILAEYIVGPYHMWFLWMICGLYLATPVLRKIAEDIRVARYFVLLFVVFSFLVSYGEELLFVGSILASVLGSMQLQLPLGFTGYYVMAHVIHNTELPKKKEVAIYVLGVASLIFTCVASTALAIQSGEPVEYFAGYQKVNVIFTSAAIFTFFDKKVSRVNFTEHTRKLFAKGAELSFGIYLIHALFNELTAYIGLGNNIPCSIMVPVLTVLIFVLCTVAVALIRKIPIIGKQIT